MADDSPTDLFLRVPARAENVVIVRQMLRGLDPLLALRPGLSDCVQTAVSEAANNVVMHAYGGAVGPLEVEVSLGGPLEIRITDHGVGSDLTDQANDDNSAFGRSVMVAFADEAHFLPVSGGGTQVWLRWEMPRLLDGYAGLEVKATGDTVLALVPNTALVGSLSAALAALGAQARIDVHGLADLRLIADALLADAAAHLLYTQLSLGFSCRAQGLAITVGPFASGGAVGAWSASSVHGHSVIGRCCAPTEIATDPCTGAETLVLLVEHARSAG